MNYTFMEDKIMNKIAISSSMIFALTLALLSACGGGGGGGGGVTLTQSTTAVLTLSTTVTGTIPASTIITGYDVTISLPAGVTVKATPDILNPAKLVTDPGVVTDNPAGSYITSVYSAATGTFPGTVKVHVASATGFPAGNFCKVNGDIAAGHYPTASSFAQPTLDSVTGFDINTTGTVTTLAGQLSLTATVVIN
jgi:hypothetical protein